MRAGGRSTWEACAEIEPCWGAEGLGAEGEGGLAGWVAVRRLGKAQGGSGVHV